MPSWFNDFEMRGRVIHVKSTGAQLPLNLEIIREVIAWLPFHLIETSKALFKRPLADKPLNVTFLPTIPRPWYMVGAMARRARMNIITDITQADAIIYFEDKTTATPPILPSALQKKSINFACNDISKSRVSEVFEQVFGYALSVDPQTYTGRIAVKSEKNGAHDGFEIQGPTPRKDEWVYQRLIDNAIDDQWVEDLRCPVIGGNIEIIFIKRRALTNRFANTNANVTLHSPDNLLSTGERANIKKFAHAMGLDLGGMDILRNREDGKIYIVDVNKTDMGPPIALSLKDKNTATTILTAQLVNLIKSRQ